MPASPSDKRTARRNVNSKPKVASSSIAERVAAMEYPNTRQIPARYAITPGG